MLICFDLLAQTFEYKCTGTGLILQPGWHAGNAGIQGTDLQYVGYRPLRQMNTPRSHQNWQGDEAERSASSSEAKGSEVVFLRTTSECFTPQPCRHQQLSVEYDVHSPPYSRWAAIL